MGLMDNFKGAMDQAQELAKQAEQTGAGAMGQMPDAGQMEYAQRAQTLNTSGLPCVATITSISESGKVDPAGGAKEYLIAVSVEGNGDPYEATVNQYLIEAAVPSYQAGARFEAKADPANRESLLLYGLA